MKLNNLQIITEKKRLLIDRVRTSLDYLANECTDYLNNIDNLDSFLSKKFNDIKYCSALYVTDCNYSQVSSNIYVDSVLKEFRGQDLSTRPYLQATIPLKGFVLSDIYQDIRTSKTYISLIQAIQIKDELYRFLIADFDIDELPFLDESTLVNNQSRQFKGDPSIRSGLFSQQRSTSVIDLNIDKVHETAKELILHNAIFHIKFHYSSSRLCLWLYDKPHFYQLHNVNEFLDGTVFACYPQQVIPDSYEIDLEKITKVFNQFKVLRFADETIYLRSASLNVVNNMVGLNFSCDGSHYIPIDDFLTNNLEYWLGSNND